MVLVVLVVMVLLLLAQGLVIVWFLLPQKVKFFLLLLVILDLVEQQYNLQIDHYSHSCSNLVGNFFQHMIYFSFDHFLDNLCTVDNFVVDNFVVGNFVVDNIVVDNCYFADSIGWLVHSFRYNFGIDTAVGRDIADNILAVNIFAAVTSLDAYIIVVELLAFHSLAIEQHSRSANEGRLS